ncbi:hypothetical protein MS3_00004874 [Schistosoma haematobium]|uniref:Uncharacterized protein n=1 Tax=Schistosoma haematobium TaxID=6185 RepID=A0A095CDJ9_SCHHA|nr:hypothetical protein MS3_00004874 [Schistosoma haematobium]KAH9586947.1 hypothetical protein MS3_00004874 [Schistosoma haematobium]CAH8536879.1 unnamed protein product [Schistosoma haematobium]CAH8540776.1 unnamed protein product [Schistosoma haematobium]
MAYSSRDDNSVVPNYALDTSLATNKLRITIQIHGLKSSTILEFHKKLIPKLYKKASNGEIVFHLSNDGFLFEFHGLDSLKDCNYRLHVNKLPGTLDNKRSQLIVREDAVEIILIKIDDSSWSSVISEGLHIVENEKK